MCGRLLSEVEEEASELLSDLIRIDTTNPPGNETKAAEFLADKLAKEGLVPEVLESVEGRGNLIVRVKGTGEGPSVLLLSHLDVVPAKPEEWSIHPFSGMIRDGFVWGRGALDCKGLVAVEALVVMLLAREGFKPKGDVVFAATADEEAGGHAGVGWLVEEHPEKIRADYAINEGGGYTMPVAGKHFFLVQTAEKGIVCVRIRAGGRPGHGSRPGVGDNAVLRMAEVVKRLGAHRSKVSVVPAVRRLLKTITEEVEAASPLRSLLDATHIADQTLDRLAKVDRGVAEDLRTMIRATMTPTMVHGGVKENVIPSMCEGVFDCRILPNQTEASLLEEIGEVLRGIEELEIRVIESNAPSESPPDTELFRLIEETLRDFAPECSSTTLLSPGGTDSRFLRPLGTVCYGFRPLKTDVPYLEFLEMTHGIDERLSIQNLVLGTSVLYDVLHRFMA